MADLIVTGRIATLAGDAGFGWAEAIAIQDGRIVASGSTAEVEALARQGTSRWRLDDRSVVVPGITDAHLHLTDSALQEMDLDLHGAADRRAILDAVAAAHRSMVDANDDGWLLGAGWSVDRMGGWPTVYDLETVAPSRPVVLWTHDHHSMWVSTAALRAGSIGAGTPDPEGGLIRRDPDGQPSGMLHETAGKPVSSAIPRPSDERIERAMFEYAAKLASLGVVAAQDPGELFDEPDMRWGPTFYRRLAREGRLPMRVGASIRPIQLPRAIEVGFRSADAQAADDPSEPLAARRAARYRGGWLKQFADGALGSRSAALLEPYEVEPGGRAPTGGPAGMLLEPAEVLAERSRRAIAAGIAVQIHGIGDAAVRTALDVLEALPRHPDGVLHRVEHAQLVHPADQPRFGATGIVASMQPCHIASDADVARLAWGERTAAAFPLRSILTAGGSVAIGTDAPVESPSPWPGLAIAAGRDFHPEQSIDLARALRAACIDPAVSAGEHDRGRLVPGHVADLIVIDAAAIDEPPRVDGALALVAPLATMIDGEVVHRDPSFDP